MFEVISVIVTVIVFGFLALCGIVLFALVILLLVDAHTPLKPIEWLLDRGMDKH